MKTPVNFPFQEIQLSVLNEYSESLCFFRGEYIYMFNIKNTPNPDGSTQTLTFDFYPQSTIEFFNETYHAKSEIGKYYEHSAEIVPYTFRVPFLDTYETCKNGPTISDLVLHYEIRYKIREMFRKFSENFELYHEFTPLEIFPKKGETFSEYVIRIENLDLND